MLIAFSIVAIHGLNPWNKKDHAFDTWRKPKGEKGKLWLRDYLPQEVPNARIWIFKYNSNPAFSASKERFVTEANGLLEDVYNEREDVRSFLQPARARFSYVTGSGTTAHLHSSQSWWYTCQTGKRPTPEVTNLIRR